MPEARKRPCAICRRWFRPNARVGSRQHACGKPECQTARRQKTQASWRRRNPGYVIAWRIDRRATQTPSPPEPLRLPPPLNQLPWWFAKDQFGSQRADFIGVMGALMVAPRKTSSWCIQLIPQGFPAHFPFRRERPVPAWAILNPQAARLADPGRADSINGGRADEITVEHNNLLSESSQGRSSRESANVMCPHRRRRPEKTAEIIPTGT
jgi:hypothetical protein